MDSKLVSTIISVVVSFITVAVFNYIDKKKQIKRDLDNELNDLLDIVIKYPYLEDKKFICKWNEYKNESIDEYLRYDAFCTRLFNFLSRVCYYYNFKKTKIENFVAIKDWIRLHEDYWINPQDPYENIDSYDTKFQNFINQYLKK